MEHLENINNILDLAMAEGASDVLISVGHPPVIRITGKLVPLLKEKSMTKEQSKGIALDLMDEEKKKRFLFPQPIIRICAEF